ATIVWFASVRLRDASIADICWGPAFAVTAWLYCVMFRAWTIRPLLTAVLVTVWGVRLAAHIYLRHRGEDPRYQAMRHKHGESFWWKSLFLVFWLQAAILWWVALPLLMVAHRGDPAFPTAADVAGLIVFGVGFAFEVIGD